MSLDDDFIMTIDEDADELADASADDEDERLEVSFAPTRPKGAAEPVLPRGVKAGSKQASFEALQLARPLLKAVENAGFEQPTRIQELAIPLILGGGDVCGTAVTGSGKTAAFMLPVLQRLLNRTRRSATTAALVLLPTRELAMQCHSMTARLAKYTSIQIVVIVGGLSLKVQEAELRNRPDVVISTPGRLIDLVRNSPAVTLESIEVLVLDEADRLLELGFRAELDEIVKMTPRGRQTLLFTATISPALEALIAASLNRPTTIKVNEEMGVATTLLQEFVRIAGEHATSTEQAGSKMGRIEREATLLSLCSRSFTSSTLIFTRSRAQAHRLATLMRVCGLKVAELHGELTQLQRMEQLEQFRCGEAAYLVATDLASRGLDIEGVQTVINFHMPAAIRSYIHRVGRTARAGRGGRAVSLVSGDDKVVLEEIVRRAPHAVKTRVVPEGSTQEWAAKVHELEGELRRIYAQEKEDKALRVAEMEANKATNLLQHNTEIASRPARTWFVSNRQKAEHQESAKRQEPTAAVHAERPKKGAQLQLPAERPNKRDPDSERKLTRKQKRKREADRGLAAQTGMDPEAVRRQHKVAAKSYKSLAKRNPAEAEQALRSAAAAIKPKLKKARTDSGKSPAAGDAADAGRAGRGKAAKPHRRTNHSQTRHIKRR